MKFDNDKLTHEEEIAIRLKINRFKDIASSRVLNISVNELILLRQKATIKIASGKKRFKRNK